MNSNNPLEHRNDQTSGEKKQWEAPSIEEISKDSIKSGGNSGVEYFQNDTGSFFAV